MKTKENKIEQAKNLLYQLSFYKDPITHIRSKRYYFVLNIFQKLRNEITQENEKQRMLRMKNESVFINSYEEKRAIKEANVTSTTYERAKKRLEKQIDNRFKNR